MIENRGGLLRYFFKVYFLLPFWGAWSYFVSLKEVLRQRKSARQALVVFALWFVLTAFSILMIKPLLALGISLVAFSLLLFIFEDDCALLNQLQRKRIALKIPEWERLSGLPPEKLAYYHSLGFNRLMVRIASAGVIIAGLVLLFIGLK